MENNDSFKPVMKWILGLTFALFVIVGLTRVYQHWFGGDNIKSVQMGARADLDLLLRAEKSFFDRYGFFTTDLVSLAIEPKYVFYKFGFVSPSNDDLTAVPGLDPSRKDLDRLKSAKPEVKVFYSQRTKLEQISFDQLASFCPDCSATRSAFKAVAAANLDDDPVLDVWTVNERGEFEHLVDDLSQ